MDEDAWRRYIAGYHDARPGITERFFRLADASPYAWLAEPLRPVNGLVLDLACGSAPIRPLLPGSDWLGIDSSPGELAQARQAGRGPLIRAGADRLPLPEASVSAVCAAMCLPVVTPLDAVLAEVRRVLRPGGLLAALVPSHLGISPSGAAGWLRVMRTLGAVHQPWPNPHARDGLPRLLDRAGFRVHSSQRRVFTLTLSTPQDAALLVDALYLPGLTAERADDAKHRLAAWTRSGRRLPLPLRRVTVTLPGRDGR